MLGLTRSDTAEAKLAKLHDSTSSVQSGRDSGYGSNSLTSHLTNPTTTAARLGHKAQAPPLPIDWDEDEVEDGGYGEGFEQEEGGGYDAELLSEGVGLLCESPPSGMSVIETASEEDESQPTLAPTQSSSQTKSPTPTSPHSFTPLPTTSAVDHAASPPTPPQPASPPIAPSTPSALTDIHDDDPTPKPNRRLPSTFVHPASAAHVPELDTPRRISFNASVRISGGIRGAHSHRSRSRGRPRTPADAFAPVPSTSTFTPITASAAAEHQALLDHLPRNASGQIPPGTSPSTAAAAAVAAVAIQGLHSARSASSSSLLVFGSLGAGGATATGSGSYASSAASRSSSPCSSLYAPLAGPSSFAPSPFFDRGRRDSSEARHQRRRQSFREFLRPGEGSDSESEESEEEEEEEVARDRPDYRAMVAEQERKKVEREARRARRRAEAMGYEVSEYQDQLGRSKVASKKKVREPSPNQLEGGSVGEGSRMGFWARLWSVLDAGWGGGRRGGGVYGVTRADEDNAQRRKAGRRRASTSSRLSQSSTVAEDEPPAPLAPKTEAFVRFGPPGLGRAKQWGWWKYRVGRGWRRVRGAVGVGRCWGRRRRGSGEGEREGLLSGAGVGEGGGYQAIEEV